MDFNWLADFVCLCRTLNFTRAAEERNITQSAFSRRIKSLENWMGVPLIQRSSYPVQLSDAGQEFLPVAQEAISSLNDIRQTIRARETGKTAFQRFAVLHTISVNYLTARIAEFEHELPELRVRVYSHHLRTCCQLFTEGTCDFLLYYRHKEIVPVFDEHHYARKDIGTELLLPVAEAQAARTGDWDLDNSAAEKIPYLGYDPSSYLGVVVDQTIGRRTPPLTLRYMDALTEAIKRRMLSGSGVAWLPESVVSEEIADGQVVIVGGEDWQATLTLSLFCSLEQLDKTGEKVWNAL